MADGARGMSDIGAQPWRQGTRLLVAAQAQARALPEMLIAALLLANGWLPEVIQALAGPGRAFVLDRLPMPQLLALVALGMLLRHPGTTGWELGKVPPHIKLAALLLLLLPGRSAAWAGLLLLAVAAMRWGEAVERGNVPPLLAMIAVHGLGTGIVATRVGPELLGVDAALAAGLVALAGASVEAIGPLLRMGQGVTDHFLLVRPACGSLRLVLDAALSCLALLALLGRPILRLPPARRWLLLVSAVLALNAMRLAAMALAPTLHGFLHAPSGALAFDALLLGLASAVLRERRP